MTIKTWEDRYNAPGIVSGHITDHMQAEITELRARVASDAITMMRLAGMSQDCALKAKGLEEHLEIAQGTLKNLWARVAELEEELATANRGIECYSMQLAKDTVQSDIDCIMAQGVEIAQLKAELADRRNQQPVAYLEKHLIESCRKIQLCNLTKTRLWADSVPVYLAAGAQPRCKHCDDTGDVHSIDGEWRGECDCGAGAQYVESYGENHRPERLAAMRKTVCDGEAAINALRQALAEPDQSARVPLTIDQIEVCMKRAYAAAAGSRNLEICFAREIESEHGIKPLCFGSYDPEDDHK